MEYRQFGNTALKVSAIGLGCSRLGGNLRGGNKQESIKMLNLAFDSGVNFYDTADSYGQGQSETLLGQTFKHHRDRVFFASKAGYSLSTLGKIATQFKPILKPIVRSLKSFRATPINSVEPNPDNTSTVDPRAAFLRQNFDADYLTKAIEGSLKRLQTDYLDLFQLHSPSGAILNTASVWETLEKLKAQGKIRYYGVSCDTIEDALICLQQPGLSSIQLEINWLQSEAIERVLPIAKQKAVAIVARQPFASGNLFANPDLIPHSLQHDEKNPYQSALRYVLQQQGVATVIPGASSCAHLQTNLATLSE